MPQNARESFGIHTTGQGVGGEGVAQIVEANVRQASLLQQHLQSAVCSVGTGGLLGAEWIGEDPLGVGCFLALG